MEARAATVCILPLSPGAHWTPLSEAAPLGHTNPIPTSSSGTLPPAAESSLCSPSEWWWICLEFLSLANIISKRSGISGHRGLAYQTGAPSPVSESPFKGTRTLQGEGPSFPEDWHHHTGLFLCREGQGRGRLPAPWKKKGTFRSPSSGWEGPAECPRDAANRSVKSVLL